MINTTSYMYPQVNGTFQFLFYTYQTPTVAELCCSGVREMTANYRCGQVQVIVNVHWIFFIILVNISNNLENNQPASTKSNHDPCVNSERVIRIHNY